MKYLSNLTFSIIHCYFSIKIKKILLEIKITNFLKFKLNKPFTNNFLVESHRYKVTNNPSRSTTELEIVCRNKCKVLFVS